MYCKGGKILRKEKWPNDETLASSGTHHDVEKTIETHPDDGRRKASLIWPKKGRVKRELASGAGGGLFVGGLNCKILYRSALYTEGGRAMGEKLPHREYLEEGGGGPSSSIRGGGGEALPRSKFYKGEGEAYFHGKIRGTMSGKGCAGRKTRPSMERKNVCQQRREYPPSLARGTGSSLKLTEMRKDIYQEGRGEAYSLLYYPAGEERTLKAEPGKKEQTARHVRSSLMNAVKREETSPLEGESKAEGRKKGAVYCLLKRQDSKPSTGMGGKEASLSSKRERGEPEAKSCTLWTGRGVRVGKKEFPG